MELAAEAGRLKAAPDLARALARLVVGRGGPRDLAAIRDGIAAALGLEQFEPQAKCFVQEDRRGLGKMVVEVLQRFLQTGQILPGKLIREKKFLQFKSPDVPDS